MSDSLYFINTGVFDFIYKLMLFINRIDVLKQHFIFNCKLVFFVAILNVMKIGNYWDDFDLIIILYRI